MGIAAVELSPPVRYSREAQAELLSLFGANLEGASLFGARLIGQTSKGFTSRRRASVQLRGRRKFSRR